MITKNIKIGNIVRIIPQSYSVQNLGESFNYINTNSINKLNFFSIPKGKVFKKKILIREITMYEFEFENYTNRKNFEFLNTESTTKLIKDTEALLWNYNKFGKAEIIKGVLFINEAHYLNPNCLYFLSKSFNNWLFPTIILSTNKINVLNLKSFSVDSFRLNNVLNWYTIPFKNLHKNEDLKMICFELLKEKKFISGGGIEKLKNCLKKAGLQYCNSLTSLSNIAILKEGLDWICINTLDFFNFILLNTYEFQTIKCWRNGFVKIHRSF